MRQGLDPARAGQVSAERRQERTENRRRLVVMLMAFDLERTELLAALGWLGHAVSPSTLDRDLRELGDLTYREQLSWRWTASRAAHLDVARSRSAAVREERGAARRAEVRAVVAEIGPDASAREVMTRLELRGQNPHLATLRDDLHHNDPRAIRGRLIESLQRMGVPDDRIPAMLPAWGFE